MIEWFKATREAVGPEIDLLHDAALCYYSFEEAFRIGRVLDGLAFGWFEEPLADRDQIGLQRLRTELDIPIVALESLMHDIDLSAVWLISGATDSLRVNARHDITSLLKLAYLAELHGARVEMNDPSGLFGLVHAHLMCAITNISPTAHVISSVKRLGCSIRLCLKRDTLFHPVPPVGGLHGIGRILKRGVWLNFSICQRMYDLPPCGPITL